MDVQIGGGAKRRLLWEQPWVEEPDRVHPSPGKRSLAPGGARGNERRLLRSTNPLRYLAELAAKTIHVDGVHNPLMKWAAWAAFERPDCHVLVLERRICLQHAHVRSRHRGRSFQSGSLVGDPERNVYRGDDSTGRL
jgi:hypothetical protein